MKKHNSILVGLSLLTSLIFVSCDVSTKGNWTDADKEKLTKVIDETEELSVLGDKREAFKECYVKKAEANYSSFSESDSDEAGAERMAVECSEEIFSNGSVKGNWSDIDKENFQKDMSEAPSLASLGDKKELFIECYLNKCEAKYNSYHEADNDEEISQLVTECANEIK